MAEAVKKKLVREKMQILKDFGVPGKTVQDLFAIKVDVSLRSLDCFADSIIRNQLNQECAKKDKFGRKVG